MPTRREVLKRSATLAALMAGAGVLPGIARADAAGYAKAAFEAKSMAELTRALGLATPVESKDVANQGPDIAENGAVVPLGASTTLAGVKRLMLLVEKNPAMLTAMFDIGEHVDAAISTRAKMGQSSNVYAVAVMNDGRVLYAAKEVKVTLGGCGG
jgi:sulfur-oxidizing protein SoxY